MVIIKTKRNIVWLRNKGRIVKRGVINQRYKYTISYDGVETIMGIGVLENGGSLGLNSRIDARNRA